jgi:hypothetical protein
MRVRSAAIPLLSTVLLFAQGVTGVISGTISDPSKAPISGATVTIINADTGVTVWTGQTNASGVYRAPSVPAGRFNVAAQANGFKRQQVSGAQLTVDQRADISLTLQIGQIAETVTVEGSAEGQLATDTSSLGNTITPSQVENLPLPSRNVLNLLALTPGASFGGDISTQGGVNSAQLSFNGSRTLNSEFPSTGFRWSQARQALRRRCRQPIPFASSRCSRLPIPPNTAGLRAGSLQERRRIYKRGAGGLDPICCTTG